MISLVGKSGYDPRSSLNGVSISNRNREVEANRVTQVKDGWRGCRAVRVTTGAKKLNRVAKPEAGHFAKAGVLKLAVVCGNSRLAEGEEYHQVKSALNCLLTLKS